MKTTQSILGTLAFVGILVFAGCKKDPCKNVDCGVHGNCVEGECVCESGWTGSTCNVADPCLNVTCVNGTCANGTCDCNTGYEGTNCDVAINAVYNGSYAFEEQCNPSGWAGPYGVVVDPSFSNPNQAFFTGLWEEAQAIVTVNLSNNGDNFTITRQPLNANFEISGTGSAASDGSYITVSYYVYPTGSLTIADACQGSMSK